MLSTQKTGWMPRLAFTPAQSTSRGDLLVVVFLRGAADGLNMIVPHGEASYYRLRPSLAIPRPDDRRAASSRRTIDLDGFFGLHPALQPLLPAWQAEHLAVVHACGAPDESRSHFKAMELMERGVDSESGPASGWIGRHLATLDNSNGSPLRAIGVGELIQRSLRGIVPASALRSISDYRLAGNQKRTEQLRNALSAMYQGPDAIHQTGQRTIEILDALQSLNPQQEIATKELTYPEGEFGRGLRQVALLVKAEVGLEAAALDLGGWDTHFAQGGASGLMANLLNQLGRGLAAFYADMQDFIDRMSVVVMTEFGRRVTENGSLGTDHGHGSALLLLGGNVRGRLVHGNWPGLEAEQLVGSGDLAVTTDYRDVLGELCLKRLNNPALEQIFPDHPVTIRNLFR